MEVTITNLTNCEQKLDITVPPAEFEPQLEKAFREAASRLDIKGFRKGKAPLSMVKKMYGKTIHENTLPDIAGDFMNRALSEKMIDPLSTPVMTALDHSPGGILSFSITFETRPDFELAEISSIEVQKLVHDITDEDIGREMKNVQIRDAEYIEIQKVEGIDIRISAETQNLDEAGSPIIGERNPNVSFYLNEPMTEQEIKTALADAEVNGVYRAKFDHTHDSHAHAVHLEITVKKIERMILPELTEEYLKKVSRGAASTVDEWKEVLKKEIETYVKERSSEIMESAIITELTRLHDFDLPQQFLEKMVDESVKRYLPEKSYSQLARTKELEKYRQIFKPSTVQQLKWTLISEKIITKNNIEVPENEILAAMEKIPAGSVDSERLNAYYRSGEGKQKLIQEKVLQTVLGSIIVKEKPVPLDAFLSRH